MVFPTTPVRVEGVHMVGSHPVVAVTINHENLDPTATLAAARKIEKEIGLPAVDVLLDGPDRLVEVIRAQMGRLET